MVEDVATPSIDTEAHTGVASTNTGSRATDTAASFEAEHVHGVYERIASHFSHTRQRPWPLVARFLERCQDGACVLDAGCGNGKYLGCSSVLHGSSMKNGNGAQELERGTREGAPVRRKGNGIKSSLQSTTELAGSSTAGSPSSDVPQSGRRGGQALMLGLDNSLALLREAHKRDHRLELVHADARALSGMFRPNSFSDAISIATIHHFASVERRREAVSELIRVVSPRQGRALILVWALEQDPALAGRGSARKVGKGDEGDGAGAGAETASRGMRARVRPATIAVAAPDDGQLRGQDVFVPWTLTGRHRQQSSGDTNSTDAGQTHDRYYHLFERGELEQLVQEAAEEISSDDRLGGAKTVEVVESGWERENWYVELVVHAR